MAKKTEKKTDKKITKKTSSTKPKQKIGKPKSKFESDAESFFS
ncbi:MAG: hypothetical protein WCJ02_07755 [bacterium]